MEDEPLVARSIVRQIVRRELGECIVAETAAKARRILNDGSSLTALIIDVGLTDGSGLDVLAEARGGAHALTPAVVLSGSCEPSFINRATFLDARYLVKNVDGGWNTLATFLADAISLSRRLDIVLQSWNLSPAVADIVKRSALGETREAIAKARGTTVKTIDHQVCSALDSTGHLSLSSLVGAVLRDVARSR